MSRHTTWIRPVACALVLLGTSAVLAQTSGLTRTVVGQGEISVPGREAVVAKVEIPAGATAGRHTHPGDEISYILEGEVELLIDGQPARTVHAGESVVIPGGVVHDARNSSESPARLVAVYVVEKGKPLASPVP